ncbi:hypothetical protein BA6E_10556 [Bacteroidales bacterium 6E]|nr:hypothetical protein BA6E_10556 [Bacteroidales bacterium 6E]
MLMNVLIVIGLAALMVGVAFALMAIRMLIKKGGKFPNTHVSGNKYLKSQGVSCATSYDRMEQQKVRQQINLKNLKISAE